MKKQVEEYELAQRNEKVLTTIKNRLKETEAFCDATDDYLRWLYHNDIDSFRQTIETIRWMIQDTIINLWKDQNPPGPKQIVYTDQTKPDMEQDCHIYSSTKQDAENFKQRITPKVKKCNNCGKDVGGSLWGFCSLKCLNELTKGMSLEQKQQLGLNYASAKQDANNFNPTAPHNDSQIEPDHEEGDEMDGGLYGEEIR